MRAAVAPPQAHARDTPLAPSAITAAAGLSRRFSPREPGQHRPYESSHHNRGAEVTPTESIAKTPSTVTGFRALLSNLLRARGTGAFRISHRGVHTLTLTTVTSLFALSALACAPASAEVTHKFEAQITEIPGTFPHPKLSGVNSLAVNSGDLYVAEQLEDGSAESRVNVFDAATRGFLLQFPKQPALEGLGKLGLAAGQTAGATRVYAGVREHGEGVVAVFDSVGAVVGEWGVGEGAPVAVAVDDSSSPSWAQGDVFVAVTAEAGTPALFDVLVFKPLEGGKHEELVTTLQSEPKPGVHVPFEGASENRDALAVDQQTGDVLVNNGASSVDVFAPSLALTGQFEAPSELAGASFNSVVYLASDAANGEIYVVDSQSGKPQIVYEFDSTGKLLGEVTGTPSGPFSSVRSVAVDPEDHHVFVGDYNGEEEAGVVDEFGAGVVVPDVTAGGTGFEPTELTPTEVTLHGTVDPDEAGAATCAFEYGTSTEYGERAGCVGLGSEKSPLPGAAGDNTPVSVESALAGLRSDTTYFYRLAAANGQGTNTGKCPQDCGTVTTPGPGLHGEYATQVASSSATLNALVDPDGGPTSVYFQYGHTTAYEEGDEPAAPGVPLGAGTGDAHAEQHLQGLAAATEYHYRAVAVSEWAHGRTVEVPGEDHVFTTPASGAVSLLDGRAWELVSPVAKHGSLLLFPNEEGGIFQASAAGDAVTYLASGPTEAGASGAGKEVQLLSRRNPAKGWVTNDIAPPHKEPAGVSLGVGEEYRFFSEDLSLAVVQPFGRTFDPLISPHASEQTAYLRANFPPGEVTNACTESCYRPLVTGCPPPGSACPARIAEQADVPAGTRFGEQPVRGGCEICGPQFLAASPDASHIVLKTSNDSELKQPVPLTEEPGDEGGLYEWSGGSLRLVSVLPPTEAEEVKHETGRPAPIATKPTLSNNGETPGAISTHGSRVVWENEETAVDRHLYLRDMSLGRTIRLDVAEAACVKEGKCQNEAECLIGGCTPQFQFANAEGTRVFFTDTQRLVAGAGARTREGQPEPDLYECRIVVHDGAPSCALSDLTPMAAGERADVQTLVVGASSDGSYVYFVAGGALAEGAVHEHGSCEVTAQACNLYVAHEGDVRLVAVLSRDDAPDWGRGGRKPGLRDLVGRVSADGRWLVFMSRRSLTGYDNVDAATRVPDEEVFLYHASENLQTEAGSLTCVSCMPSGARPLGVAGQGLGFNNIVGQGWADLPEPSYLAGSVPGWESENNTGPTREPAFSTDEGRVFFDSFDALVPGDVNGGWDVYEWEPLGVGGCTTATSSNAAVFVSSEGGCVGLISSGTSSSESGFLEASESGNDVFFLTKEKLVSSDVDTEYDLYDAHVCSSESPCVTAATGVPACETADACRAAPGSQPGIFGAPASATFNGPGNVLPVSPAKPKTAAQIRAEKLAKALSSCRKKYKHAKKRRAACEKSARKKYALAKKPKQAKKSNRRAK